MPLSLTYARAQVAAVREEGERPERMRLRLHLDAAEMKVLGNHRKWRGGACLLQVIITRPERVDVEPQPMLE